MRAHLPRISADLDIRKDAEGGPIMRKLVSVLVLLACVAIATGALALAGGTDTADIELCHKGSVTILVDANAVPAHLQHGDVLGRCAGDPE
jgi:hypothetical protein